ncbi:hypothetical protein [Spirosoma fluminis]
MEQSKDFLSPKLEGERFEDHALPLNILEDFSALEELIVEVAKKIYLEENPGRKRVPKGFTDNVSLKLTGIDPGSAIPKFAMVTFIASALLIDANPESMTYFEKARDRVVEVVSDANKGTFNPNLLDVKHLSLFNRIGKNLLDGESMDLSPNHDKSAILNKSVRKRILLSRNEKYEYSDTISVNASVTALDKKHNTFTLDIEGNAVTCNLENALDFYETIALGIQEYESNTLLSIKATGIFNEQDKLIRIEGIESMDILDPYDVNVRLSQLSKIEDNWYEGFGKAPGSAFLRQFGEYFSSYYNTKLPLPAIFPTLEGNIQLEWSLSKASIMLEVSKEEFSSELIISKPDDTIEELTFALNSQVGWVILNDNINAVI